MKQREYSEKQLVVMEIIGRLIYYLKDSPFGLAEIVKIKKDYGIKEPFETLRQYINNHCFGTYHIFHFTLNNKDISINTIGDMLTDEWCSLYPLTNKFYVVEDNRKEYGSKYGSNCENSHIDHFLTLEPKED